MRCRNLDKYQHYIIAIWLVPLYKVILQYIMTNDRYDNWESILK